MKNMKNAISHFCFEKIEKIKKDDRIITPILLDSMSKELSILTKTTEGLKPLSENTCRETIVEYALREYSTEIFGVESLYKGPKEISDKTVRKMKNQRKKDFPILNL